MEKEEWWVCSNLRNPPRSILDVKCVDGPYISEKEANDNGFKMTVRDYHVAIKRETRKLPNLLRDFMLLYKAKTELNDFMPE